MPTQQSAARCVRLPSPPSRRHCVASGRCGPRI